MNYIHIFIGTGFSISKKWIESWSNILFMGIICVSQEFERTKLNIFHTNCVFFTAPMMRVPFPICGKDWVICLLSKCLVAFRNDKPRSSFMASNKFKYPERSNSERFLSTDGHVDSSLWLRMIWFYITQNIRRMQKMVISERTAWQSINPATR